MAGRVRVVDLSIEIKEGSGVMGAEIQRVGHKESIPQMLSGFPGVTPEDLPDGLGWAHDILTK